MGKPPLSPTQLVRDSKEINSRDCERCFKRVSRESYPTPIKLYKQGNLKHVSTKFLRNHQIPTPVQLHIHQTFSRSLGFRGLGLEGFRI